MEGEAPILYPYQRRYLADKSRWKAACWSRQTGKTFTTTLEAVLDVLEAEAEWRVARWTILSISRDRALDAIRGGAALHLKAIGAAFEALDQPFEADEMAHMVRLPGGSYIRAIAAKPETARGMSDNLILDEFAHHKDNRALWRALVPVVSRPDLKLRVISTPNGVGDMFHEIMTDGLGGLFSRHTVTIHDAVADGLPRNVDELRKAARDPDTWAQEYECAFLDQAGREWLSYDEILAALDAPPPPAYDGRAVYVGMDIAARGDLSVIAVLEDVGGGVLALREMQVMRGESFAAQLARLDAVMRTYRVARVAIDQTGMGEMPVQEAQRRHGQYRVTGVIFTAAAKLEMAVALKDRLQARRLLLPVPDADKAAVIDDLRAVKMEPGAGAVPRLLADRDSGGHADRFWALALACAAAGEQVPVYAYESVARRSFAPRQDDLDGRARARAWEGW
ncbi:terminase family protein [Calidifontimicrobium sp. SYSU G02091]|uniref:phage terminase large subunit family protein n=1 Tax=Calidifontimicrobium sp. SYSU G02091 TaxID=2926421 RepID=UPI001F52C045|nr:terminase family protein [Calidifontimicrobium sp. SYSU G02091]MCI1193406.1 terminase family protein [Calidifontimicrobium sp. SYSU G02091]